MLVMGRLLERDGRDRCVRFLSLDQVHFQVFLLRPDQPGVAAVADAARYEYRRVVFRAERLETVQRRPEFVRDVAEQQFRVDLHLRDQHFGIDVLLDIIVEPPRELFHVFGPHRQACRIDMSSEIFQQVGARFDGLVQVEARHAARRTGDVPVAHRQYDGRPIVSLD